MSRYPMSRDRRRSLLAMSGAMLHLAPAWAQGPGALPSTLRLIVGYPAGGGGDTLARQLGKRLSSFTPQSVVIENRPGAGGTLAATALSIAPPDGSVVYMADSSILVAPAVYEKIGYDPRALTPVLGTGQLGYCVVVHPSFPARTAAELIQVLKAAPGKYSYASPGVGNIAHLAAESFKRAAGVDMVHIPYKGGGPALTDLMGGQVPICFISLPPALAQAQAGKLRILAVTTRNRWETAPSVPALSETLPGFEAVTNSFVVAPPKTPAAVVDRLAAAFKSTLEDPELRQAFLSLGATLSPLAPEALAQQIADELKRWPELVRSIGIQPGAA